MIGKIISDKVGITKFFGDIVNPKINFEAKVDDKELEKLKTKIESLDGDEIRIRAAVDESSLKDIDGLADYAVDRGKQGKNINKEGVTKLLDSQIANQAHGILGVKKAIDAYNESLIKNEDGTTKASEGTKKLISAISQGNSSFGNFLTGLDGAKAGLGKYATSLATATLKEIALTAATTAMNMAISFGVSAVISGLISLFSQLDQSMDDLQDNLEESANDFEESANEAKELEDELKNCIDRIDELQKLADNGTISVADKEELKTLRETNDELERKIALKKEEKIDKGKKELDDARKVLDKPSVAAPSNSPDVENGSIEVKLLPAEDALKLAFDRYKNNGGTNEAGLETTIENAYGIISPVIDVYKKLIDNGYELSEEQKTEYDNLKRLQDEYLLYRYNVNGVKETFKALNEEQKKSVLSDHLTEKGLSQDQISAILGNISSDDLDELWGKDFSFTPPEMADYATAEEYGKAYAEAWLNGVKETSNNETTISTPLTFKEAWKSIGKSGDEKADKKALEAKEKLEELAEAGKLTTEAFKDSSIAEDFMKQTKLSAEEATEKINKLKSSADQLASMKTGISSISSILGEKEENQSSKKTRTKGIGADTLAGMPDDVKAQTKEYEHFVEVLGDGTSSMDKCKNAANKLATAYVNSNNFLANLDEDTRDYYTSVLDEMGVENAAEVVTQSLAQKTALLAAEKEFAEAKGKDLSNATWEEITAFAEEAGRSEEARNALYQFALQKELANGTTLDTDSDIDAIIRLVENLGGATSALRQYNSIKNGDYYVPSDVQKALGKESQNEIDAAFQQGKKKTKVGTSVKPSKDSGSKGSGSKSKDKSKSTKQSFDWLDRRVSVLNGRLDLLKAKIENVFTVKKKNSIIDDEIKKTNKLISTYKKQATVYKQQANKSARSTKTESGEKKSKLSKKLKKQIQNGQIKGSRKQLIKAYGEKTANAIQEYQDYWDKYQEARTNIQSGRTSRRELKIQQKQNWADYYDSLSNKYDAQIENAFTAKEKNKLEDKKIKSTQKSYDQQIKIAQLEKDSVKVATLRAEKEKAIRDIKIEQHQNLADEYQSTLDRYSAEKELATTASDKNNFIEQEKAATQALYAEKIAIAGLEGNISEQYQLQAELQKQLRDLQIEQHQNLADEYQSNLDMLSAQKDNLNTADEKNGVINQEKATTQALYTEKIAIAHLEGDTSKEQQLQAELTKQMVVLEKEKLDNIAAYYSNLRKITELQNKNLSNAADELEARGYIVTSKLYSSQIALNNETKKNREEELMKLEEQHDKIKEGTQEWYDSLDAIQACKDGIAECTKNTIELEKASRNVGWKLFEKLSSRLDLISAEYDLAIKLMSNKKLTDDDTGNFTKEGTATLGAYYSQLVLTQEKAKNLWNDLAEMKERIDNGEEGFTDPAVLDEYNEKHEEYINLIENEYDIQQNLIDLMKEKYQAELDYLQDLITKRKELLQYEKDAYDYQRSIEEKTKNIGTIQKQMISLSGDDSEAAKTKLQQLQTKLDEANHDLADAEYQQWISDQQKMLDNLYNEYEAFIDDKLNDVDALLQEAVTYLGQIDIGTSVSNTLTDYYEKYGYHMTEELTNINTALGENGSIVSAVGGAATMIIDHLEQQRRYQGMADDVEKEISEIGNVYSDKNAIDRYYKAQGSYDNLATAGDNGENIQNHVSSSSKSTLDTTGQEVKKIYASVDDAKAAIERVNLDNESDYNETNLQFLEEANRLFNGLSTSGKQLLGDSYINLLNYRNGQADYWKGIFQQREQQNAANEAAQAEADNQNKRDAIKNWVTGQKNNQAWWIKQKYDDSTETQKLIHDKIFDPGSGARYLNNTGLNALGSYLDTLGIPKGYLIDRLRSVGFSHGGIAETLQKVPGMNGDDGWVTLKKGEGILTPEQTKAFIDFVHSQNGFKSTPDIPTNLSKPATNITSTNNRNTSIGDVHLNIENIELPNVVDPESFVKEFQNNPKIERIVHSMVYDSNNLGKYKW